LWVEVLEGGDVGVRLRGVDAAWGKRDAEGFVAGRVGGFFDGCVAGEDDEVGEGDLGVFGVFVEGGFDGVELEVS
jgi:hypothetical protein